MLKKASEIDADTRPIFIRAVSLRYKYFIKNGTTINKHAPKTKRKYNCVYNLA